jgi:uncharacterized protein
VKRRWHRFLLAFVAVVTVSAFGVVAVLPEHILFRQRMLFSIFDLDSQFTLRPFNQRTHDRLTLRSWYHPPQGERPTIVYFAGREGDLIRKPAHLLALAEQGYGLLLAGYRGYGGNPGWPSERAMFLDAASLLWQAEAAGLAPNGYVLYGYSMGSGIASNAAVQVRPRALILEAPISSFIEAVRQQAGNVPRWMVRTQFDNIARIAELDIPVLLLAGGRDTITPPWFAISLARANESVVTMHVYEDANHMSIIRHGGRDAIAAFLKQFEPPSLIKRILDFKLDGIAPGEPAQDGENGAGGGDRTRKAEAEGF